MNRYVIHCLACCTLVGFGLLTSCSDSQNAERFAGLPEQIDFNWHVRPILSNTCFTCHGTDPSSREAGLRLDLPETAYAELPETPGRYAIVPGEPENSELIRRISSTDIDQRMPPSPDHAALTELEIEILKAWVAEGAEYKTHWAFTTPVSPEIPASTFPDSENNEIDRFIQARLAEEGLQPSARADKETLISRVYQTLTGLPPGIDEIEAFINDDSPDAYEQLVDRLLESTEYAQHMTSYWLDIARWSESDGFLDDHHDRLLWPWRDWVVSAFEQNMPFDQFSTWQLAGDLIPNATREQKLATAFGRIGSRTTENGAIAEEYKAEYMIDRTDNLIGTAFLGLTLGCTRCHDHKFDPITQADYYSLGAFFNSLDEPGVYGVGASAIQEGPTLAWPDEAMALAHSNAEIELEQKQEAFANARSQAILRVASEAEQLLADEEALSALLNESVSSDLAAHYTFDSIRPFNIEDVPMPREQGVAPSHLVSLMPREDVPVTTDPRIPRNYLEDQLMLSDSLVAGASPAVLQGPIMREGISGQALFFDENNKGYLGKDIGWYDRNQPFSLDFWFYAAEDYDTFVPVLSHRDDDNSAGSGYRIRLEEDGRMRFVIAHSLPANMIAATTLAAFPVQEWTHITLTYDGSSTAAGTHLYWNGEEVDVEFDHDSLSRSILPKGYGKLLDPFVGLSFGIRFREKAPIDSGLDEVRVYNKELKAIEVAYLHNASDVLGDTDDEELWQESLSALLVAQDEQVAFAQQELIVAAGVENEIASDIPQVLIMGDAPDPIPTYVLNRGVYTNPGERVFPRAPDVVFPWDESLPQNRLGLTQWLFDPENPLTSRVFVNRMWQMHFNRGIVETTQDFGFQGSIPTHPELLDWLALEFIDSGWDIHHLHRLIVTSATYTQSSDINEEHLQLDPDNILLARAPRWRMTAEMVRDNALAKSGLLVEDAGGPSVFPYQPDNIWNSSNSFYMYPDADAIPADDHHRRSIYSFVKRNAAHPAMSIFDLANRTVTSPSRNESNTPLQSLVLMNDPQYVEAYRELASLVLLDPGQETVDERLSLLYQLGIRREPTAEQLTILRDYYELELTKMNRDPQRAEDILSVGVTPLNQDLDPVELAALTNVTVLVMNSPDAYTVR